MKKALGLFSIKSLRDNYLSLVIITALSLISVTSRAQVFTPIHNAQAQDYLAAVIYFGIPYGPEPVLNSTRTVPGGLFFNTIDSTLYTWTGDRWIPIGGGASAGVRDTVVMKIPLNVIYKQVSGARFDTVRIKGSATPGQVLMTGSDTDHVGWGNLPSGGIGKVYGVNGLTNVNDSTLRLGGTLSSNPIIDATAGNYHLSVVGDGGNSDYLFQVGSGTRGLSVEGSTLGLSVTSAGIPAQFVSSDPTTNNVQLGFTLGRASVAGAAGIGIKIRSDLSNNLGTGVAASELTTKLTNATSGSETAQFELGLLNTGSGSIVRKLAVAGSGLLILDGYGSNGFRTGDTTTHKPLVVDGSGNIGQGFWAGAGGGGGDGNGIYSGSGSLSTGTVVTIGSNNLEFDGADGSVLLFDPGASLYFNSPTGASPSSLNLTSYEGADLTGQLNLPSYIGGAITGTPDFGLAIDASGKLITTVIARGTSTLVGGTITVSTPSALTGSKIYYSVRTPGGTQGFLSAPTASVVNATSFVINSTSATETSTVDWWITN